MSRFLLRCAATASVVCLSACAPENSVPPSGRLAREAAARAASPASSFQVSQTSVQLRTSETYSLQVTNELTGKTVPQPSIAFTSADPSVASVTPDGIISAVSPGATTVAVTRGSHEVDVAVTVRYRPFEGPWHVTIDDTPAISANGVYNADGSLTLTIVTWNTRHTGADTFDWKGSVSGESFSGADPGNPANRISLVESPDGSSFSGTSGFTSFGHTFTYHYVGVR